MLPRSTSCTGVERPETLTKDPLWLRRRRVTGGPAKLRPGSFITSAPLSDCNGTEASWTVRITAAELYSIRNELGKDTLIVSLPPSAPNESTREAFACARRCNWVVTPGLSIMKLVVFPESNPEVNKTRRTAVAAWTGGRPTATAWHVKFGGVRAPRSHPRELCEGP